MPGSGAGEVADMEFVTANITLSWIVPGFAMSATMVNEKGLPSEDTRPSVCCHLYRKV